eukprot:11212709-Lingulodinium_polyedra.AAC.1
MARGTGSGLPPSAKGHGPWAWRRTFASWGLAQYTCMTPRATTSTAAFSCRGSMVRCSPGCGAPL